VRKAFESNGRGKLSRVLYVARQSLRRKSKIRQYPAPRQTAPSQASASDGRHAVDLFSANEILKSIYDEKLLERINWEHK
jgi:hypothetical protein